MRLRIPVALALAHARCGSAPAGLRLFLLSSGPHHQFKRWVFFLFNSNLHSNVGVGAVTNDQTLSRFLLGFGVLSHLDPGSFFLTTLLGLPYRRADSSVSSVGTDMAIREYIYIGVCV
jgi:hypothetical protein